MGPVSFAQPASPSAIALAPFATVLAGGETGTLQALRNGTLEVVAGRYAQSTATSDRARFRERTFSAVTGVVWDDAASVFYVTETTANRISMITPVDPDDPATWTITALAGASDGRPGFADGALASTLFREPSGLYLDPGSRTLYVADTGNHVIRAINLSANTVTTVAGTPASLGFFGDRAPATAALLYRPGAIVRCATSGDLYIADTGNQRIRRVEAGTGTITTVLGTGVASSTGQGIPSSGFPVDTPRGLACDDAGNVYVSSSTTVRLLAATIPMGATTGVVDESASVTTIFGGPTVTTFPATVTKCLGGLTLASTRTVLVADECSELLIELSLP